ncbi:type VI secretion protein VasK, partial [Pseudomonas sp. DB1]|nr:type VI secretion protein VasK [Pseudomonas boanensis]
MLPRRMMVLIALVVLAGLLVGLVFWRFPELVGLSSGGSGQSAGLIMTAGLAALLLLLPMAQQFLGRRVGAVSYREVLADDAESSSGVQKATVAPRDALAGIKNHLREHYGYLWRRRIRVYLVVGETEEVEAIAPSLTRAGWLEGHDALLLCDNHSEGRTDTPEVLRRLRRSRPLDGIVWALSPQQSLDPDYLGRYQRQLRDLARRLRWQAPVHLWEVRRSEWEQPAADAAVGCALSSRAGQAQLESHLDCLLQPLRERGLARMQGDNRHDALLRLAHDLQNDGIARWKQAWTQLRRGPELMLRGLWFSLPLPTPRDSGDHHWRAHPAWNGVLADRYPGGRPQGWTGWRVGTVALLGLLALWVLGLLLSFASNRAQVAEMQAALATLDQPREGDEQLLAFNELVHE